MTKPREEHIDHEGGFSLGGILRDKLHVEKSAADPAYKGDNPKDDEQLAAEIQKRAVAPKKGSKSKGSKEAQAETASALTLNDLAEMRPSITKLPEESSKTYRERVSKIAERLGVSTSSKRLEKSLGEAIAGQEAMIRDRQAVPWPPKDHNMQDQMKKLLADEEPAGEAVNIRQDGEQTFNEAAVETLRKIHRIDQLRRKKITGNDITELKNLLDTDLSEEDFSWAYDELLNQFAGSEKAKQRENLELKFGKKRARIADEIAGQDFAPQREAFEKNDFGELREFVEAGDFNLKELQDLQKKSREHKQWDFEIQLLQKIVEKLDEDALEAKGAQRAKLLAFKSGYERQLKGAQFKEGKVEKRRSSTQTIFNKEAPLSERLKAVDYMLVDIGERLGTVRSAENKAKLEIDQKKFRRIGYQYEDNLKSNILAGEDWDEKANLIYSGILDLDELAQLRQQAQSEQAWGKIIAVSEGVVAYWDSRIASAKDEKERKGFTEAKQAAVRGLEAAQAKLYIEKKKEFEQLKGWLGELLTIAEKPQTRKNEKLWEQTKTIIAKIGKRLNVFSDLPEYNQLIEKFDRRVAAMRPKSAEEIELIRKAAEITLARIPKYTDEHPLHAATEREGDEKFKDLTRKVWQEFVVHGITRVDDDGKITIKRETDLDGRSVAGLLVRAGFDISNVEYVAAGESRRGKINVDTGNRDGLVVEDEGLTAYIDHHTTVSGAENSSAKVAYEVLTKMGLLEKRPELDRIVEFVTNADNMNYPAEEYGVKSARTMLGLRNFLSFDNMELLFKIGKTATTPLSDVELKQIEVFPARKRGKGLNIPAVTLWDRSEKRRETIEADMRRLAKMAEQGLVVDTKDYGQIIVDIGGTVKAGPDSAKASGAGLLIKWMPETNSFFLTALNGKKLKHQFSQGIPVRDTMWIKARTDETPLNVKLADVLREIEGGEFKATGELKKYLEKEKVDPREGELRRLAEEMLDPELEAEMESMGMTDEEKEEERNSTSYKRQREEQLAKIIEQLKK